MRGFQTYPPSPWPKGSNRPPVVRGRRLPGGGRSVGRQHRRPDDARRAGRQAQAALRPVAGGAGGRLCASLVAALAYKGAGSRQTADAAPPPRNRWFVDSPLEEPGFEPLVPFCRVVVSGWNRNAGIGEEDDLEGVVCRGDRAFESHLLQRRVR